MITNLVPEADAEEVKLLRPISFSIRDDDTYIDPLSIKIKVGYASTHSNAEEEFDSLPSTRRFSVLLTTSDEPSIEVTEEGLVIKKTADTPQRSVYCTKVSIPSGYPTVLMSANLRRVEDPYGPLNAAVYPGLTMPPPFLSAGSEELDDSDFFTGTVLGIEYGPRNKVVYLWFQRSNNGNYYVRLTTYINGGIPDLTSLEAFDWSSSKRYTLIWDEAEGYFEIS